MYNSRCSWTCSRCETIMRAISHAGSYFHIHISFSFYLYVNMTVQIIVTFIVAIHAMWTTLPFSSCFVHGRQVSICCMRLGKGDLIIMYGFLSTRYVYLYHQLGNKFVQNKQDEHKSIMLQPCHIWITYVWMRLWMHIYIYICIAYRTNTLLPHSSQYTYMYTQRYVCLHGCMYACMYVWYTRPGDENTYRSSFAADTLSVAAAAEPFFEFYCFRFCLGLIGLVMSWETLWLVVVAIVAVVIGVAYLTSGDVGHHAILVDHHSALNRFNWTVSVPEY